MNLDLETELRMKLKRGFGARILLDEDGDLMLEIRPTTPGMHGVTRLGLPDILTKHILELIQ